MHHDTFEDLVDDVEAARREWGDKMDRRTRELLGWCDDLLGRETSIWAHESNR
jgi:hypothetical protein